MAVGQVGLGSIFGGYHNVVNENGWTTLRLLDYRDK